MDKIDTIISLMRTDYQYQRNVPEPGYGVTRRGYLSPEEAYDVCEVCGPIIPRYVKLTGRWLKGTCACYEQRYIKQQQLRELVEWRRLQIRENYEWLGEQWSDIALAEKAFGNFDASRQPVAFDTVQDWMLDMHGSLILHSEDFGTGKTHLLASIVNTLRIDGKPSRFTTAPKLFRAIQECISRNEQYTQIVHKACSTPLLVLDDVDKAKPNEFRQEVYFEIVDERVKRGLPIALSTNRVSDLAAYVGGAACSRLSIGQITVDMAGVDYRTRL
jgi:DNA replication protein DnaC